MDKKMKRGLIISSVILAVFGLLAMSYFVLQIPLFDASGWCLSESGQKMYLDYYGKPTTGWLELDGHWYYFDEKNCQMQTGWQEIEEERYLLNADGTAYTGWYLHGEDWYYFSPTNCAMRTGWVDYDGSRFYMDEDGIMQTGWVEDEQQLYYLDEEGRVCTGWLQLEDAYYYLDETTAAAQTGWFELGTDRYYADQTGAVATGWTKIDANRYYFSLEDRTLQTGWLETQSGKYYLAEDGVQQTGWTQIDGARYYFNVDGRMRTGWVRTGSGSYYLTEDGPVYTGWMTTPRSRYYFREDGLMATGFLTVDGIERYFLDDGSYIPLVNRDNKVPADYEPVLVEVEGYLVDQNCRDALIEMMEGARAAGRTIEISSAFRDEEKQISVWEEYRQAYMEEGYSYEEAEKLTARFVAVPGTSEHHLGLALDFYNRGDIYEWLAENSWRYGFILRYIKDDGVTAYEPWHFRYVGKEMAKDVYESHLILEKYLETLK